MKQKISLKAYELQPNIANLLTKTGDITE